MKIFGKIAIDRNETFQFSLLVSTPKPRVLFSQVVQNLYTSKD